MGKRAELIKQEYTEYAIAASDEMWWSPDWRNVAYNELEGELRVSLREAIEKYQPLLAEIITRQDDRPIFIDDGYFSISIKASVNE